MGANPWGDAPDTDCNATILMQSTTSITLNGSDRYGKLDWSLLYRF